jgi:uncharacterized protein YdeI (BOF family)
MIVERDEDDRSCNAARSQRGQMVEITGSVEQEWRGEICFVRTIELGD